MMGKIVSTMVLGLAIALALTGCVETTASDNVRPKATYQSYGVSYDEDKAELQATAEFNVGGVLGTTLELRSPSRVSFNGGELSRETFLGTRYVRTLHTNTPMMRSSTHTWEWYDQDGRRYLNTVTLAPVTPIDSRAEFSRYHSFSVRVVAPDVMPEDRFRLEISQTTAAGTYVSAAPEAQLRSNNTLVVFAQSTSPSASRLERGRATLRVVRERWTKLQETTDEGGSLRAAYYGRAIPVEIVE